jgi:hypothetical protein
MRSARASHEGAPRWVGARALRTRKACSGGHAWWTLGAYRLAWHLRRHGSRGRFNGGTIGAAGAPAAAAGSPQTDARRIWGGGLRRPRTLLGVCGAYIVCRGSPQAAGCRPTSDGHSQSTLHPNEHSAGQQLATRPIHTPSITRTRGEWSESEDHTGSSNLDEECRRSENDPSSLLHMPSSSRHDRFVSSSDC